MDAPKTVANAKPTATKPTKPAESKRSKFLRLANNRVPRVVKMLAAVGNLSAPSYEWTQADVIAMFKAIGAALNAAATRFSPKGTDGDGGFKLS